MISGNSSASKKTFQQQHRRTNAGGAQFQRFLDARHREPVGLRLQCLGHGHRAMAVGIGLDHGEGLGPGDFSGQLVVMAQGLEIDQGTGWTHVGRLLGSKVNKKTGADQQRRHRERDHC